MALSNLSPINRLEKFLAKIAGKTVSATPISRTEWFLDEIAKNMLPTVSGSDNGKVLTVSSGAWSAQTPATPSGIPVIIEFSESYDAELQEYTFTTSANYDDVSAALSNNAPVLFKLSTDDDIVYYSYKYYAAYPDGNNPYFGIEFSVLVSGVETGFTVEWGYEDDVLTLSGTPIE